MRLSFVVVAVTMLLLFYFVTFRKTRSEYCAWWCAALVLFLSGSAAYLLDGTAQQWWANPVGSALLVGGTACTWAGARTLRTRRPPLWLLATAPVLVGVLALFDDPGTNTWAAGPTYLLSISVLLGLSTLELWKLNRSEPDVATSVTLVAGAACAFYLLRWGLFVGVGPDQDLFIRLAGSGPATLVNMVLLVTVSYSMTILGNDESTRELRRQATHDGLTGLLNRSEFLLRAPSTVGRARRAGQSAAVVVADLDHFKSVNDSSGHLGGDRALREFAVQARASVRPADLVARFGGDEFVLLLVGRDRDQVTAIATQISARLAAGTPIGAAPLTVSYGLAEVSGHHLIDEAINAADAALYRAKAEGRDRAVHAHDVDPDDTPFSAPPALT